MRTLIVSVKREEHDCVLAVSFLWSFSLLDKFGSFCFGLVGRVESSLWVKGKTYREGGIQEPPSYRHRLQLHTKNVNVRFLFFKFRIEAIQKERDVEVTIPMRLVAAVGGCLLPSLVRGMVYGFMRAEDDVLFFDPFRSPKRTNHCSFAT